MSGDGDDGPMRKGRKKRCPKEGCGGTLGVVEERVYNGRGHHGTLFRCGECGKQVIRG